VGFKQVALVVLKWIIRLIFTAPSILLYVEEIPPHAREKQSIHPSSTGSTSPLISPVIYWLVGRRLWGGENLPCAQANNMFSRNRFKKNNVVGNFFLDPIFWPFFGQCVLSFFEHSLSLKTFATMNILSITEFTQVTTEEDAINFDPYVSVRVRHPPSSLKEFEYNTC
jgi:hypothetical protein